MTSVLGTLQVQLLTDIVTTSIDSATFGPYGKVTTMPFAECYYGIADDFPADSNSFTDAEMEFFITVTGNTADSVETALQELIALWKPDAIRGIV